MAITATGGSFQVGRVISSAMGTLSRNALALGALAFVLSVLPGVVFGLLFQPFLTSQQPLAAYAVFTSPFFWLSSVISIAGYCILQGAVTYIAVVDLDSRRPDFAATIATALRCALPLLGLYFLFVVAVGIGVALLIVPGLMLAMMWCVAGPPLVVERTGIIESFNRSRALTKGSRWPIFGTFLVILVVTFVVRALLAAVMGTSAFAAPTAGFTVVDSFIGAIESLVLAVVIAAIYVELRTVKEGASTTSLAAIFA